VYAYVLRRSISKVILLEHTTTSVHVELVFVPTLGTRQEPCSMITITCLRTKQEEKKYTSAPIIMQLHIKTLSGVQHTFNVDENDKIEYLKKQVEEKVGIPPIQQRLVFSGKILADDKTVKELNLKAGTTIQLILQLKGGF
jgi:ubiquitin-like protein Nedd8